MRILWLVPGPQISYLTPCSSVSPSVKKKKCCRGQMKSWIWQHKGNWKVLQIHLYHHCLNSNRRNVLGVKQSSLLGQAVTQQKGQPERGGAPSSTLRASSGLCLKYILQLWMQEVAFIALLCAELRPSFTYHFPRGVLGESAYTLCSPGSKLRSNSSDGKSALNAPGQGSVPVPPLGLLWP